MTAPEGFDEFGASADTARQRWEGPDARHAIQTTPLDIPGDGTYTLTAITTEPEKWRGSRTFGMTIPATTVSGFFVVQPAVTTSPSGQSAVTMTLRISGLTDPFPGFRVWLY